MIPGAPTFAEALRDSIVYFIFLNPDGWRRGSITELGLSYQHYNGNGMDLNRDWPDIGFAFRPYSPLSEPETRAFSSFFREIRVRTGERFGGAVDLHGQITADALSYTLIGHGRKDLGKDTRVRETTKAIHRASEKALLWSPLITANDTPKEQNGCEGAAGFEACAQMYGQTWGTVYDTINYTTTGAFGDWLDSLVGLDTDGLDNEMSFSHLAPDTAFDKQIEQLHVDGNKALIYSQLAQVLDPPGVEFDADGAKGYVANRRLARAQGGSSEAPAGTVAQEDVRGARGAPQTDGTIVFPIEVRGGPQPGGQTTQNGGMRVDITKPNAVGVGDGNTFTTLRVQCRGCDDHPQTDPDDDGWVTVAEDYNQSFLYRQAGITAAVNDPQVVNRAGEPVEWRAQLDGVPTDAGSVMDVVFSRGPATVTGDTSGSVAPSLAAYDVANTDFFRDLNRYIPQPTERFTEIDPRAVIDGRQSLDGLRSLALADDPLPGYTGSYGGGPVGGDTGAYSVAEKDAFLGRVRDWVRGGGTLVLTDGALRALPDLARLPAAAVGTRDQYVGQDRLRPLGRRAHGHRPARRQAEPRASAGCALQQRHAAPDVRVHASRVRDPGRRGRRRRVRSGLGRGPGGVRGRGRTGRRDGGRAGSERLRRRVRPGGPRRAAAGRRPRAHRRCPPAAALGGVRP